MAMTGWLTLARAAAAVPPASPRSDLLLGDLPIGSIDPAVAARIAAAELPIRRRGEAWSIEGAAEASLAAIARWLERERISPRWRDELLPVVDGEGRSLAVIERSVVRVLGLRTFAVHLSGRSPEGGFWVQQRAFDKATDPGCWDTLMGGQQAAGETTEATLERETWEEAGLVLADLTALARGRDVNVCRPVEEGYMDERIAVYRAVLAAGTAPSNQDGEVIGFECLGEDELRRRLAAGAFTLEATLVFGDELEGAGL